MGCCCKKRKESSKVLEQNKLLEESITESQINEVKIKVNLDYFENIKLLGKGTFGKVLLVKLKTNNTYYAMKILNKNQLKISKQEIHTKNERDLMVKISSPFIVSIKLAFQDETNLYLVSEFMQGGELFFHLTKEKYFSEEFVKFYAMELVLAISHIHENNAVYRDLKPENILMDKYGHIKLTDFGLAKILKDNEKAFTICGTFKYIAPEILLNRGYKKEVDWWSLGCVIFEMLEGKAPFGNPKGKMTLSFYKKNLNFYYTDSDITKQFIKELLVINPENRLGYGKDGSTKIKNHKFFNGVDWDKALRKEYKPPFIPELSNELDLKYFDKTFTEESLDLNKIQKNKTSEIIKLIGRCLVNFSKICYVSIIFQLWLHYGATCSKLF
jgi:protein-serine/threonine kinase